MLLCKRHMQPSAGQKEEFDDLDVGRQRTATNRIGIGKVGIAAEQTLDHRSDETPLQQVRRIGFFQGQRGKESQVDGAIGGRASIERVDDVIRLAKPERQSDHQIRPNVADDILSNRLGIGKLFRRHD